MRLAVDDKFFRNLNDSQMLWYQMQIIEDEIIEAETYRDVVEYMASFWDPAAVERIRDSRKQTFVTEDKSFDSLVSEQFGRELPGKKDIESSEMDAIEVLKQHTSKRHIDSNPYLDMDLDNIKFVPFEDKS